MSRDFEDFTSINSRLKLKKFYSPLMQALRKKLSSSDKTNKATFEHCTLAWGRRYLANYFRKPPSGMHLWLGEELNDLHESRGTKINVIGPRGGAKSTIGTLCYALRCALEGWESYIWIVSDTKNQAQTHLENIKNEIEENERIAQQYPESSGRGPRWRSTSLELNNGVIIEAFGTGQRIRGRRRRENRPTLIICDDLQNDGHMDSALQRENSTRWFHGTLLKAGTKQTNILNLATALHRDALAMQLHQTPGWKSHIFRSIKSWPANTQLWSEWEEIYSDVENVDAHLAAADFFESHRNEMLRGVELLWPEEEDIYTLMKMRVEEGRTAFEREKQCSPIDPERCEWPEDYFDESIWFADWPTNLQIKTLALDPSKGSDSKHGDYSAFVLLGIDTQGILYVEADLAKRPTPQMVRDGVDLVQKHRVDGFGVEANQFQELLAGEFEAEFSRRGIWHASPYAIHNHVNKHVRIRRLGPYLSQKRIRFHRSDPSTRLLVEQMRDFPLGAHDDGPDALEMALRLAEEMYRGKQADDGLGTRIPISE